MQDAFDEIYRRGFWKQGSAASGLGSEGPLAENYAKFILDYAVTHGVKRVVDGGCGDFAVGSRIAPAMQEYIGLDISKVIIERNRTAYASFPRATFRVFDMTSDPFPPADLILIRQVLQHLTNSQIEGILQKLDSRDCGRVLITEEVHNPSDNPVPNLDLPSHTVRTRVSLGSGVFIDEPPFSRPATRLAVIDASVPGSSLKTFLMVFELTR